MCKYSKQKNCVNGCERAVNAQMGNTVCELCVILVDGCGAHTKFHAHRYTTERMKLRGDNDDNSHSNDDDDEKMQNTEYSVHRQSSVVFAISTRTVVCAPRHSVYILLITSKREREKAAISLNQFLYIFSIGYHYNICSMLLNKRKLETGMSWSKAHWIQKQEKKHKQTKYIEQKQSKKKNMAKKSS